MIIASRGILAQGAPDTARAALTFPAVTALTSGALIATVRAGPTKDHAEEQIEIHRSGPDGSDWHGPTSTLLAAVLGGKTGSLKLCYLTETAPGELLAAAMWVDRTSHPGAPLFNADTDGCLPMAILLARSTDDGHSWSAWTQVPLPADLGPPSLTAPILALPDGTLVMSIETNKTYNDASPWDQRAVFLWSDDRGETWSPPQTVAHDSTGRIFNWDLRCGVLPDGGIATFAWTYDTETQSYLDIHRRIVNAQNEATSPSPLGFADQAGRPAMLPDGRVVLPFVDRFGDGQICARLANSADGAFHSEVVLHTQISTSGKPSAADELLTQMSQWSYGLPWAEALTDKSVLIVWYAGSPARMDIHWARLKVPERDQNRPEAR